MICAMETTALHDRMKSMVGKTTFRALGQATNHNPETVRRYMSGQAPSVEFLSALVGAYAVNADWLLTGRGPQERSEVRSAALSTADPNELMAAIADRMESMCDRIDRIEVFVQTTETKLRAAGKMDDGAVHVQPNIALQSEGKKATHDDGSNRKAPADDPADSKANEIADAIPRRPHPDAG